MKNDPNQIKLLPNKFKKLGIGLLVISLAMHFAAKIKINDFDIELLKSISNIGLLISFSLIAFTRDKDEDELTLKIRTTALVAGFLFGVVEVILQPFVHLLIEGQYFSEIDGVRMLIHMFLAYFVMSFVLKRKR
jgi:hypothetical protein